MNEATTPPSKTEANKAPTDAPPKHRAEGNESCQTTALKYLATGLSVVPLQPGGELPTVRTWKEYKERRMSEEEVNQLFRGKQGIGILQCPLSDISVLAIDNKEALEHLENQGFPPVPLVEVGNGYHAYVRHLGPEPPTEFSVIDGVTHLADQPIVVAPPSVDPQGNQLNWVPGRSLDDHPPADLADWLKSLDPTEDTAQDQVSNDQPKKTENDEEDNLPGQPLSWSEDDPWPEPVDGAALLHELASRLSDYVILPAGAAVAVALWVLNTYVFDAFRTLPILLITSPVKRSGKTRLIEFLVEVCNRTVETSSITPASIFRVTEEHHPTFAIDEADTFINRHEDFRSFFNAGHRRKMAFVVRCVGKLHRTRKFSTWAPKALGMIGRPADTICDRSIEIQMKRKTASETVKDLTHHDEETILPTWRRKARRWANDNSEKLKRSPPLVLGSSNNRTDDNWVPLLTIANQVGENWLARAREAALTLIAHEDPESPPAVLLLEDLQQLFADTNAERLPTANIIKHLISLEERPWPEWRGGKPLTPTQLASLLKPFGIRPTQIRTEKGNRKGYDIWSLQDAFKRYLDPSRYTDTNSKNQALAHQKSDTPRDPVSATTSSKPL